MPTSTTHRNRILKAFEALLGATLALVTTAMASPAFVSGGTLENTFGTLLSGGRGRMRKVALIATMFLGLLLAACGGPPQQDQGQPAGGNQETASPAETEEAAADPCTLLTDGEVSAATGFAVKARKAETEGGKGSVKLGDEEIKTRKTRECTWTLESPDAGIPSTAHVRIYTPDGKQVYDVSAPGGYAGKNSEPVEGIGDGAYIKMIGRSPVLMFLSGETAIEIQYVLGLHDPNEAKSKDIVTQLGRAAAEAAG
jgi:hypothetical protein